MMRLGVCLLASMGLVGCAEFIAPPSPTYGVDVGTARAYAREWCEAAWPAELDLADCIEKTTASAMELGTPRVLSLQSIAIDRCYLEGYEARTPMMWRCIDVRADELASER